MSSELFHNSNTFINAIENINHDIYELKNAKIYSYGEKEGRIVDVSCQECAIMGGRKLTPEEILSRERIKRNPGDMVGVDDGEEPPEGVTNEEYDDL